MSAISTQTVIKNSYIRCHTSPYSALSETMTHEQNQENQEQEKQEQEKQQQYKFKLFEKEDQPDQIQYNFAILQLEIASMPIMSQPQDILSMTDMSGSMGDISSDRRSKMQHVIHVTKNIMKVLSTTDTSIEVIGFDDEIEPIIPLTKVVAENIQDLYAQLETKLLPRNSTNIHLALTHAKNIIELRQQKQDQQNQFHIFMSDGQVTCGTSDKDDLFELVSDKYPNIFIGFGMDHDACLMQHLAKKTNGSYYVVDKIENAGLVFGEILHGILYPALKSVVIEIQNGEIYNYLNNTWSSTLEISSIPSEAKKTYHLRSLKQDIEQGLTKQEPMSATITALAAVAASVETSQIVEEVEELPALMGQSTDLSKYMLRQKTMELMFMAVEMQQQPQQQIRNSEFIVELKDFLKFLQKHSTHHNLKDDDFMQTLCGDIYITIKSFSVSNSAMYSGGRQNSQGRELSYNVTHVTPHLHSPPKLRRQNNAFNSLPMPTMPMPTIFNYRDSLLVPSPMPTRFNYDDSFDVSDDENDDDIDVPTLLPQLSRTNTSAGQTAIMSCVSQEQEQEQGQEEETVLSVLMSYDQKAYEKWETQK